ncbi:CSLREA domain-containing protein [Granulicella rosea]|uniref:CSLREA domain-containing protein n=1 Tax=Granulicella rosea TaxID=474952 RepID=A0A239EBL7_9BACT|nr:right-handed parallel beta-helix repeat-containing protein [Granulicella rosea]SNS41861.1 CSLREA domain-containing protein [Granulicella rosea]
MNASAVLRAIGLILLTFALSCIATFGQTTAIKFNVNSTADKLDATPGDGICSTGAYIDSVTPECTLRAAINEASALAKTSPAQSFTITVQPGVYNLTASDASCLYTGIPLCPAGNVNIVGADPATTIVDGGGNDRVFLIDSGATIAISNLTIQGGSGPGGYSRAGGGGVFTYSNLTLTNDIFTKNISSVNQGSAVENAGGNTVIKGCTFIFNTGNAIFASQGASNTSIDQSYFTQNTADGSTAIDSFYAVGMQISNSTFTYNHANGNTIIGGAGTPTSVVNSTISYNTVGNSGVLNIDNLVMNNDTLYGNTAGNSNSGIGSSNLKMANTIIAGDPAFATNRNEGDLCSGTYADLGHNISSRAMAATTARPPMQPP